MSSALNFNLNEEPAVEEEEMEIEWESGPTGDTTGHNFDLNFAPTLLHPHQASPVHSPTQQHHQTPKNRLSTSDKLQILSFLLKRTEEGRLPRGAIKEAAQSFSFSARTISRLWKAAREQDQAEEPYNVTTKFHNGGRKRIEVNQEAIKALKMGDRTCIRDLASNLNINKSTCHRLIKKGYIRPHSNALHPGLTDTHRMTRLQWALKLLKGDTAADKTEYYSMFDLVHIDEKWFYQTRKTQKVYLAQGEKGKYRAASSSKFIPKVMFSAAVARPRYSSNGVCTFDGKIGVFPFTYQEPAKRASKNRDKGTMVTKLVESINKLVSRSMLINQILPAIKEKWPADENHKTIFIQQHNARAHITQDDPEWQEVYEQDGFTFILIQQPANSPDLNALDLGFFRSIQSLMHKKMPKSVDGMLDAVHEAYNELSAETLRDVWYTLQYVMNEILKSKGGNAYDMPHHNKKQLRAEGNLPREIKAPTWAVHEAWKIVHEGAVLGPDPNVHIEDATEVNDIMDAETE